MERNQSQNEIISQWLEQPAATLVISEPQLYQTGNTDSEIC